ncbi:MAG TPA: hypothetical protein VMF30_09845 [Pirellulales bacterium]|nr:hypothetical protein [Pirellulales bacterium]
MPTVLFSPNEAGSEGSRAEAAGTHAAASTPDQAAAARICGACTACCTVLGVEELDKENYRPCPHNCGHCAIYDSRPATCRTWSCQWLLGHIDGDERLRPEQLGLMFNREVLSGQKILVAYEVWPQAGRQASNGLLLKQMCLAEPVILRDYGTRACHVYSPDRELQVRLVRAIEVEWLRRVYDQTIVSSFPPSA